jgi:hypothetical protein
LREKSTNKPNEAFLFRPSDRRAALTSLLIVRLAPRVLSAQQEEFGPPKRAVFC